MIKIGDFAKLGQVSIVTLRHYDEVGLLKPVSVDDASGYRYYSVSQLPRLNRILALKDLGFSLEQIEQVLAGLTVDQLRGMLKMKHAEVEQHIAREQERLMRIEARLGQIEQEDRMADYDVALKKVAATWLASRRMVIPTNDQAGKYLSQAFQEVYEYIYRCGVKPAGPHLAFWGQPANVRANEDVEAAVPIPQPIPGTDRIKVYEAPAVQVVYTVHQGEFVNFRHEHIALLQWIEANDLKIIGPYREIYINHDPHNMAEAATEIQYPVEKHP